LLRRARSRRNERHPPASPPSTAAVRARDRHGIERRRKASTMGANDISADHARNEQTRPGGGRSVSEQAERVGDEMKDFGRHAKAEVGDAASKLRERGEDALESGREMLESSKNELEQWIAENPMKAILVALGVGAAIGYAIRRV
jgi:ElaB/YqjD/DUF883 family membrane-anchored ribosome-binding protein